MSFLFGFVLGLLRDICLATSQSKVDARYYVLRLLRDTCLATSQYRVGCDYYRQRCCETLALQLSCGLCTCTLHGIDSGITEVLWSHSIVMALDNKQGDKLKSEKQGYTVGLCHGVGVINPKPKLSENTQT